MNEDDDYSISDLEDSINDDDITSPYKINSSYIFLRLSDTDEKLWKNYNRTFLIDVVQPALKSVIKRERVISIAANEENKRELIEYENEIESLGEALFENESKFPFPDYFLVSNYRDHFNFEKDFIETEVIFFPKNVVFFYESCEIKSDDYHFDLFFALQLSLTSILQGRDLKLIEFLEFHLMDTFKNDFKEYRPFLESVCRKYKDFLVGDYSESIESYIQTKENETAATTVSKVEKLVWTGKPSQFGHVFLELASKGYIDLPSTNGQGSYGKFARICWDLFDFDPATTPGNIEKQLNPEKNDLSLSNKAKFSIPEIKDIGKPKKK